MNLIRRSGFVETAKLLNTQQGDIRVGTQSSEFTRLHK